MNLMKFGYKKEEIQIRKMTMAELRLGVVQELLKKNYRYAEIRLVNTTCGEVDILPMSLRTITCSTPPSWKIFVWATRAQRTKKSLRRPRTAVAMTLL